LGSRLSLGFEAITEERAGVRGAGEKRLCF
jgi:hypothetical protein